MNTQSQFSMKQPVRWRSLLQLDDTIAAFRLANRAIGLDGYVEVVDQASWSILNPAGVEVLRVSGARGSVPQHSGVEAFMVLAKTSDLFPEAIHLGFENGYPLLLSELDMSLLMARYSATPLDYMRALATRAGLVSVLRLADCRRQSYPQNPWILSVDKSIDATANLSSTKG